VSTAVAPAPVAPANTVPFMSTALTQADIDASHAVLKSGMLRAAKKLRRARNPLGQHDPAPSTP
jgi:hypothetical protein